MMAPLRTLLQQLRDASPREKAGLSAVLALAAGLGAASAFDGALAMQERMEQAAAALAELELQQARQEDSAYREAVGEASMAVWRSSIVQTSEGVARAELGARVEAMAFEAMLGNPAVEAGALATADDELVTMAPLTLTADFDWFALGRFLQVIEAGELSLFIDGIAVYPDADGVTRMELRLRAPFLHDDRAS